MSRAVHTALAASVALAALAPGAPASPPDAGAAKSCRAPSVEAGFVRALRHDPRTSCRGARSIAAEWVDRYLDGRFTRRFRGWRCEGRSRIRCVRGSRFVRFGYGV